MQGVFKVRYARSGGEALSDEEPCQNGGNDGRDKEGEKDQPDDMLQDLRGPLVVTDQLVDVFLDKVCHLGHGITLSRGTFFEHPAVKAH